EVSVKVTRNRTVIKNEKHTVYVAQSALEKKSGTKKKEVVLPGVIEAKNKKQFNGEWFLRKVKIDGEAFNADDFREHILMGEISVKVENLATFERRSKNSVYSMGYEIIGCYDGSLKLDNFAGDKLYMWPTSDGGIYCKINLKEVFQLINLDVGMYFYKQEQISSEQ
ncbi:MAG: hypothetical protein J6J41_01590, partial [Clostridia bacterium]|nr:hypothetical protein [Clostridia bacterium]